MVTVIANTKQQIYFKSVLVIGKRQNKQINDSMGLRNIELYYLYSNATYVLKGPVVNSPVVNNLQYKHIFQNYHKPTRNN